MVCRGALATALVCAGPIGWPGLTGLSLAMAYATPPRCLLGHCLLGRGGCRPRLAEAGLQRLTTWPMRQLLVSIMAMTSLVSALMRR